MKLYQNTTFLRIAIVLFALFGILFFSKTGVSAQFEAECPLQYPGAQHCPSGYTLIGAQLGLPCAVGLCCPPGYSTDTGMAGTPLCCNGSIALRHGGPLGVNGSACCPSGTSPQQEFTSDQYACRDNLTGAYSSGIDFFKKSDQQTGYECKKENYCQSGKCWIKCTNLLDKLRCAPSGTQVNQGGTPKYCDGSSGNWIDSQDGLPPVPDGNPVGQPDIKPITCDEVCAGENDNCGDCCTAGNVWTEIGCISPTQNGVVIAVMRVFIGIVTGLAVLRFAQAGFMLNTDDPEKIKEGKSIAVSAVIAIIFGTMIIVILNFIGVDILRIGQIIK